MTPARQSLTGLVLAAILIGSWAALQVIGVFFYPLEGGWLFAAPLLAATICWLNVGLFIVAHDAMHTSLAPGRPELNRFVGTLALLLYAGFSFARMRPKHFAHHRAPGTDEDPDFSTANPAAFWAWYRKFLVEYFGLGQLAFLTLVAAFYLLLGAGLANVLLFWALPAIVSSLQLFYFGTFRPHRAEQQAFVDDHRARSSGFGWLASLLSCYHFGYHHEHHLAPHVPWWRLPAERRSRAPVR